MKKLILILGILIGLSIGVSAQVRVDATKTRKSSLTHKRVIKKNF